MKWLTLVLLFIATPGCIQAQEDHIAAGALCVPSTQECPSTIEIRRNSVGKNQLDYRIYNHGQDTTARLIASIGSLEMDDAEENGAPGEVLAQREYELIAGDVFDDRMTSRQLGVRATFQLQLQCEDCDVKMDWVFTAAPVECLEDSQCSGGWFCESNSARCVECRVNTDCDDEKTCDTNRGRCIPVEASCATAGKGSLTSVVVFLLAMLILVRARRRVVVSLVLGSMLMVSTPAQALNPPRGSIGLQFGPRWIAGPLGDNVRRGSGMNLQQELRWRYWGLNFQIGSAFFLTTQEPPPFSHTLFVHSFGLGPRGFYRYRGFEVMAGGLYQRIGLAANSLVRITGPQTSYHSFGGVVGVRQRWENLQFRLEGSYAPVIGLEGSIVGVEFGVSYLP